MSFSMSVCQRVLGLYDDVINEIFQHKATTFYTHEVSNGTQNTKIIQQKKTRINKPDNFPIFLYFFLLFLFGTSQKARTKMGLFGFHFPSKVAFCTNTFSLCHGFLFYISLADIYFIYYSLFFSGLCLC